MCRKINGKFTAAHKIGYFPLGCQCRSISLHISSRYVFISNDLQEMHLCRTWTKQGQIEKLSARHSLHTYTHTHTRFSITLFHSAFNCVFFSSVRCFLRRKFTNFIPWFGLVCFHSHLQVHFRLVSACFFGSSVAQCFHFVRSANFFLCIWRYYICMNFSRKLILRPFWLNTLLVHFSINSLFVEKSIWDLLRFLGEEWQEPNQAK